jgi:hypothetical protein
MVWRFIKYWANNLYIGLRFGYCIFGAIGGISAIVSAGLLFYKNYNPEAWKSWEEIVMKIAFCLFLLSFLIAAIFVAPFIKDEKKKTISNKGDIKQQIRAFLEALNPEILQRIDTGRKEIEIELLAREIHILMRLSEHLDFDKFLRFEETGGTVYRERGRLTIYRIYPKDALKS